MDTVTEISGVFPLWEHVRGGNPEVRIAIIDGPVDASHPALANSGAAIDQPAGLAPASAIRSEHGTHVSSIIVGQPGSPVVGLAPNCTTTIFPIYRETAEGELEPTSQATLALAINRALAGRPHIINISSGQPTPTGQAQRILADAVRSCAKAGTLIVAAAGNDGCRCLQVPAAIDTVLAVGACDLGGRPLAFSNFGDAYLANGILAPGEAVKGASPREHVALRSGTSFATPIVSGVIALLLSRLLQEGRAADPLAVKATLLETALPCESNAEAQRCLAGRLDLPAATAALFDDATETADALMPSSQPRAPPVALGPGRRQAPAGRFVFSSPLASEGKMGEQTTTAASAPHILGPDGNALVNAAAVAPSEAPAVQAPPQEAAVAPAAAHGAPQQAPEGANTAHQPPAMAPQMALPVPFVQPPGGDPNAMWHPMPMYGAMMPTGWSGGVMPNAVPQQALVPSVIPQQALAPAAPLQPAPHGEAFHAVQPSSGCGCGGVRPAQAAGPQMVFPIGRLYYDFGIEARVDYFVQAIASWRDGIDGDFGKGRDKSGDMAAPYNPEIMVRYLTNKPRDASSNQPPNLQDSNAIIWTLTIDSVPVYAIKPQDVFGLGFYADLLAALSNQELTPDEAEDLMTAPVEQQDEEPPVERVSIAGYVDESTTRLLNGTMVPTLYADWRGFYQWNLDQLLGEERKGDVRGFLERIYNEFRNVGLSPQDRALNYSAINAHNTKRVFNEMAKREKRLDTVEVDRSTICRPDSDCWDITYRFFDPDNVLTQAREVFQYTIDVSDLVPVPVGDLRHWEVY